jgi:glycosyltransferase involved in cell wall biosynthesis
MNVLLVHNFYQQPGGEDAVFADEAKMLRNRGHDVRQFTVHNDAVAGMGKLELARRTIWNRAAYDALRDAAAAHRADVVHFHNTLPLISPAGYRAAHDAGAAVVQTLHNYRLLCPTATFYRDGGVCEDCMGKSVPWPGVLHKCYRDNRAASAVIATMLTVHRAMRTYRDEVDVFIALTEFSRSKFIEGGLPAEKIIVKPNFVDPDPGVGTGSGGYALFVGRLTEEKGVLTLLQAWETLAGAVPLKILGDGPLRAPVEQAAARRELNVEYLGRQPLEKVSAAMGESGVLIFPSTWYEGLPRTIVESFAKGTPVIASRLGSMTELVEDGRTGYLFPPGDGAELADRVRRTVGETSETRRRMREQARGEYERRYTAERNYDVMMSVYDAALHRARPRGSASVPPGAPGPRGDGARGEMAPPRAASH